MFVDLHFGSARGHEMFWPGRCIVSKVDLLGGVYRACSTQTHKKPSTGRTKCKIIKIRRRASLRRGAIASGRSVTMEQFGQGATAGAGNRFRSDATSASKQRQTDKKRAQKHPESRLADVGRGWGGRCGGLAVTWAADARAIEPLIKRYGVYITLSLL